jgi:voltage-gated potassium channel
MADTSVHQPEATPKPHSNRLWEALGLRRRNWPGRYTVLLFMVLLMIVGEPMFAGHRLAQALATVSLSLVLLAALYTLNLSPAYFTVGLLVMVPTIVTRWALHWYHTPELEIFAALSASAFIFITVVGLVRELFSVKRVTLDTISAAISAYLLMGLAWAFLFAVVAMEHPGSFSRVLLVHSEASPMFTSMHNFFYYSFVCLTTTGFGDIAPASDAARAISILESVTGQMYLAILIARLVSLQVAQSMLGTG